jgi:hypothetical protein
VGRVDYSRKSNFQRFISHFNIPYFNPSEEDYIQE